MSTNVTIPIICLVGYHDSGKTTLGSQIVQHLKKAGLTVGIIKSSKDKGILFDEPGTDTHTYALSGADQVAFVAPDKMVLQTNRREMDLPTLVQSYFHGVDIVIAEGFKHTPHIPKIEINRDQEQYLFPHLDNVVALVSDTPQRELANFTPQEGEKIAQFIIDTML